PERGTNLYQFPVLLSSTMTLPSVRSKAVPAAPGNGDVTGVQCCALARLHQASSTINNTPNFSNMSLFCVRVICTCNRFIKNSPCCDLGLSVVSLAISPRLEHRLQTDQPGSVLAFRQVPPAGLDTVA